MSTRIERNFEFQAAIYFKQSFTLNLYELKISMGVVSTNMSEQTVALERIKVFFSECLQDSVFIEETEKHAISKFKDCNIKICTLPDEPYDQIICIAILNKLNAIVEGRLTIEEITFGSKLNDDVKIIFGKEEQMGPFAKHGWWHDSNTAINNLNKENKKEKIVKLSKCYDWINFDLQWDDQELSTKKTKKIYFLNETDK